MAEAGKYLEENEGCARREISADDLRRIMKWANGRTASGPGIGR